MNKDQLLLPNLIDRIALSSSLSLDEMMKDGLNIINDFRADPVNREAIAEVFQNSNNPSYKISNFGEQLSMRLFMNNVITIFQLQRDNLYSKMPQEAGFKYHQEITKFYMTYALASLSALYLKLTTMADISVAVAQLRDHFFEFLTDYAMYM
jgi:hypothetical protein